MGEGVWARGLIQPVLPPEREGVGKYQLIEKVKIVQLQNTL